MLSGGRQANHASVATRELIHEVARRLGYSPNQAARALRQKQSKLIAILDATNFSSYSPQILKGINDVLRKNQCQQMHCIFDSDKDLKEQMKSLETFRPDGWIVVGYLSKEVQEVISKKISLGYEIIQVCSTIVLDGASAVYVDPYDIGSMAAEFFLANGHRHVLYAAVGQGERCLLGFQDVFARQGLEFLACCFQEEYGVSEEYGKNILRNWIRRGKKETAIFAFNDVVAAGIIAEAARNHVRIPQDLSVLGVDDQFFCSLLSPSLSTVRLPQYDRGVLVGEMLMRRLQFTPKLPPEIQNMSPVIAERESTCKN